MMRFNPPPAIWLLIGFATVQIFYTPTVYPMGAGSAGALDVENGAAFRGPEKRRYSSRIEVSDRDGSEAVLNLKTDLVNCDPMSSIQFLQEHEGCKSKDCREKWQSLLSDYKTHDELIEYLGLDSGSSGERGRKFRCGYGKQKSFLVDSEFANEGFRVLDTCIREAANADGFARVVDQAAPQALDQWLKSDEQLVIDQFPITIHHVGIYVRKSSGFDRSTHAVGRSIDIAGIRVGSRYFRYQPAHPCTHWGQPEIKGEWDSFWKPFFGCIKRNGLGYVSDDEPSCRKKGAKSPSHSQVLHLCHPLKRSEHVKAPWMFGC
jgi:hypothetical protein